MQNQPAYAIDSVDHALQLLLMLQRRDRVRVSDAAAELGVARSTAHRLLSMLRYRGFVIQHPDRSYGAGPVFRRAGLGAGVPVDIRAVARPRLEWLRQRLDETAHLMVPAGRNVEFLDSVETGQALRVGTRAGAVMPAHLTSGGKALLAELSAEELAATFPDGPPAGGSLRADDIAGFHRALLSVRRRGYGVNIGESERGISAVGTCVYDLGGRAVAALTVSAPSLRLPRGRIPRFAEAVRAAARRMEADLASLPAFGVAPGVGAVLP
jgi:IclR family transcriptional regulator, acetate operon repressor